MSNELSKQSELSKESTDHGKGGGNFAAGLFVGGIAAAAGMFLFGTKKGAKVTEDLKKHWQKLEMSLSQEIPARPNDKIKLPFLQVVRHTLEFAAKRFQQSQEKHSSLKEERKQTRVSRGSRHGK